MNEPSASFYFDFLSPYFVGLMLIPGISVFMVREMNIRKETGKSSLEISAMDQDYSRLEKRFAIRVILEIFFLIGALPLLLLIFVVLIARGFALFEINFSNIELVIFFLFFFLGIFIWRMRVFYKRGLFFKEKYNQLYKQARQSNQYSKK
jgi:hypothetical protein